MLSLSKGTQQHLWYRWLVFATVVSGTFMVNVDSSIVNVAIPSLERQFQAGPQVLQWVISAYSLITTSILPVIGSVSDRLDRKRFFIAGVLIFTMGSVFCAWSSSLELLISSRIVQAIGGAMIMGNVMSIVSYTFPAGERGKPLGLIGSVVAAGTIVGPSVGGFLIHTYGWPSMFWINVPIGLSSAVLASFVLLPIKPQQRVRHDFDVLGALLFFVAITMLLFALSNGSVWGWLDWKIWTALVFSLLAWGGFIRAELRQSQPLIDLTMFRSVNFSLGNATGYLSYVLMIFPGFLLPLLFDHVFAFSTAYIGLLLTPQALSMILFSPIGGWVTDKYGSEWPTSVGMVIMTMGLFLMAQFNDHSSIVQIILVQSIFGLGLGLFTSPNNVSVLESAPLEQSGVTGSLIATVRNFGRVSGVALTVLFLQNAAFFYTKPNFIQQASLAFVGAGLLGVLGTSLTLARLVLVVRKQKRMKVQI